MDLELESQHGQPLTKEDLRREFKRATLDIHSAFAEIKVGTTQRCSKMEQQFWGTSYPSRVNRDLLPIIPDGLHSLPCKIIINTQLLPGGAGSMGIEFASSFWTTES